MSAHRLSVGAVSVCARNYSGETRALIEPAPKRLRQLNLKCFLNLDAVLRLGPQQEARGLSRRHVEVTLSGLRYARSGPFRSVLDCSRSASGTSIQLSLIPCS
jgi:hypothetical protein